MNFFLLSHRKCTLTSHSIACHLLDRLFAVLLPTLVACLPLLPNTVLYLVLLLPKEDAISLRICKLWSWVTSLIRDGYYLPISLLLSTSLCKFQVHHWIFMGWTCAGSWSLRCDVTMILFLMSVCFSFS